MWISFNIEINKNNQTCSSIKKISRKRKKVGAKDVGKGAKDVGIRAKDVGIGTRDVRVTNSIRGDYC